MKLKIELETEEEVNKLTAFLPAEAAGDGLVVADLPAARGLVMYIRTMRPQDREKQLKASADRQKPL